MALRLRRNETRHWLDWVNARYRVVAVAHRDGMHLTRDTLTTTLCLRRPDPTWPINDQMMCRGCRATAMVAYLMANRDVPVARA